MKWITTTFSAAFLIMASYMDTQDGGLGLERPVHWEAAKVLPKALAPHPSPPREARDLLGVVFHAKPGA